ncbi:hypothetical protein [Kitasatospora sp. NPDC047058]|uniref:hypothetical protein n=1 Tax=Kitasatospora sp. NPDC047058 TaxID=3155620 RepID=UPI0033EC46A1
MAPLPNGVYAVTKPNGQLLTLSGVKDPVVVLPPGGEPGEQEWELEALDNGNVRLRNLRHPAYAGYDGPPQENTEVIGSGEPREWALYQAAGRNTFHVVVPGGPVDGRELALDFSVLDIFPPRTALRPLDVDDRQQAWTFEFHE